MQNDWRVDVFADGDDHLADGHPEAREIRGESVRARLEVEESERAIQFSREVIGGVGTLERDVGSRNSGALFIANDAVDAAALGLSNCRAYECEEKENNNIKILHPLYMTL